MGCYNSGLLVLQELAKPMLQLPLPSSLEPGRRPQAEEPDVQRNFQHGL